MKTPRTLAQLKEDPRVDEVYKEGEASFFDLDNPVQPRRGYWLNLSEGWITYDGVISLHEPTVSDLCKALKGVMRLEEYNSA